MNKIYADETSWPQIQKWGFNDSRCWYHPITNGQLKDTKYGDIINFKNSGVVEVKVKVLGVYDEKESETLFGRYGRIVYKDWTFTRLIKVETID
jgi:hypothetical protein